MDDAFGMAVDNCRENLLHVFGGHFFSERVHVLDFFEELTTIAISWKLKIMIVEWNKEKFELRKI